MEGPDFAVILAGFATLAIALYVVLDGFDLGVGILFPFAPRTADRDVMMASLAPIWDGNETWLVLGGMTLLVGFPAAFAILLPAFYMPLALMLFGLVLRGVAFEFRSQGGPFAIAWSAAFAAGSALAAFCQGAVVGAFVSGDIQVKDLTFAGGPLDWLGLFEVLTGLGVMAGYALLGAGWLIWKTDGPTQTFAREIARPVLLVFGAAIALVSVWTPLALPSVAERWFSGSNLLFLAPLPAAAALLWLAISWNLHGRRDGAPFTLTVLLFLSCLAGLAISLWPWAVPGALDIWAASSEQRTQRIGASALFVIVPIILSYVGFSYWVFRGKVSGAYGEGEAAE